MVLTLKNMKEGIDMTTLDTFKDKPQEVKLQSMSEEHIEYLYEQSYQRQVDKNYDYLIERRLADEREAEVSHKQYAERNYIRIGGN